MALGKKSLILWACPLLLSLLFAHSSETCASPPPGLRTLHTHDQGMTLEWIAPPLHVQENGNGELAIAAGDYPNLEHPGAPRLPFTTTLLTIPNNATPHLHILSRDETTVPLPAPLAIAPRPGGVLRGRDGLPIGGAFATAAPAPGAWPTSPAAIEPIGTVRGARMARLTLYPAIPEGASLRVTRRLHVEIVWETTERSAAAPAPERSVQHTTTLSPTAYIEVDAAGMYEVTYDDLDDLGFAGADMQQLRLFHGSDETAIEWVGDGDTTFEAGEAIRFYAKPRFSRWTGVDVYRLIADAGTGKRITDRDGSPLGLPAGIPWVEQHHEENLIYTPDCFCGSLPAGRDGDRWVWKRMRQPDITSLSFNLQVPAVDTAQDAELTLWFVSYTDVAADPDHRVDVALNSTPLGRVEWEGKAAITATLPITAGVLLIGQNTLEISLPGISGVSVEEMWLDGFAFRYARSTGLASTSVRFESTVSAQQAYSITLQGLAPYRAYDVTDPLHPRSMIFLEIVGKRIKLGDPSENNPRRYIVTSAEGIHQPTQVRGPADPWAYVGGSPVAGADLLIVTHPDFAAELDPLVDLRQSQGISTTMVNVLGIYDTWGDGRADPDAIRAFIAEAYATWNPVPLYLLLVGDGSYDPRQYDTSSPITFIPPYLADVDPWAGETAADNRYACVDGGDTLPDLLLGRLPVQTAGEAQTMVSKIVAYETTPVLSDWNTHVPLVADDVDTAGDFATSSDTYAATHVSDPFTVTRRYCVGSSPSLSDCSAEDTEAIHAALMDEWNDGALLIQFTGHSSWQQWGNERFFHLDDVAALGSSPQLPMVLDMTCFTGAFQRPEATLDEALVTAENGAIAAWGPTGLGVGTGHDYLSNGFFDATFEQEVDTIGEAVLAGKLELAASGVYLDLLDTYNLLGDPCLRLNRNITSYTFLPLVLRDE